MSRAVKPWLQVQTDLHSKPITEGTIGGAAPLYVERYLLKTVERTVGGLSGIAMPVLLGGARVQEGEINQRRADFLPSEALLVPAGYPTHWHYTGAIDCAVFYFPDHVTGIEERLKLVLDSRGVPQFVGDVLVSAIALQIVNELHKGAGADQRFLCMLTVVMLEQIYRVLTAPAIGRINPRHVHFARLQAVLSYLHGHLADDISAPVLARQAQVSLAHFRRLFQEAMGVPPHRYVLTARLEQARKLLSMTTLPISRIAAECGFSSQSHFTARFREVHAATPAEYRSPDRSH